MNEIEEIKTEVLVLGAGPGGYTAAFRAADLGKKTLLVERHSKLGGVCLNVGCIPSKTLLHAARVINESKEMAARGIRFGGLEIDLEQLRKWKNETVNKLTGGLNALAKQRKVKIIRGEGNFSSPNLLRVAAADRVINVSFEHAVIAAGSHPARIPGFPYQDKRIIDSAGALNLEEIPEKLLIIGGGIIGLEMATVYEALGSRISVAELLDSLIPGCDPDLVRPLQRRIQKRYENIYLNTKVTRIEAEEAGLRVCFDGPKAPESAWFDRVLVATGRQPNGARIGAEHAGISVDHAGFIATDKQQRTNVPHIFAVGDVTGNPMLAHKAVHQAKIAAEVIAGHDKAYFDAKTIPSVAYTDPEIAWMGLTEAEAKAQGIPYEKGAFPWAASGRSLSLGRNEGMTKLLFARDNKRLIGAGITGPNAGELIAETVLALEMGADVEDISLTVHPHPTLSETLCFAAEAAQGTITDMYMPRKKA
ncbi:MAG: dihydrolipoyl dehydrogenase [Gammaproteobacteria bacterium]|nr:dihydrolipoyl dehydrogenase [Gammaproteobacteria bacterium]